MEEGFLLAQYVPESFTQLNEYDFGMGRIYRHEPSGCPVALIVGGHQGTVIGAIVYYREESDSMNMEMECPMESMDFTMEFLEKRLPFTKPRDTMEGLWGRFLGNLLDTLSRKTGFTKDGTSTPALIPPVPTRQAPTPPSSSDAAEEMEEEVEQEEEEEEDPCMICLDRPANTTVVPCLHSVVCAECSPQLEATADAKICCQCRLPITGVFYPDNTVKSIE